MITWHQILGRWLGDLLFSQSWDFSNATWNIKSELHLIHKLPLVLFIQFKHKSTFSRVPLNWKLLKMWSRYQQHIPHFRGAEKGVWTKPGIEWWEALFHEHSHVLLAVLQPDHLSELICRNTSLEDKEQACLPLTIKTVVSPSSMFLSWNTVNLQVSTWNLYISSMGLRAKGINANRMLMLPALLRLRKFCLWPMSLISSASIQEILTS